MKESFGVDALTKRSLETAFDHDKVDGWVEKDDKGHLYIELFPLAISQLDLQPGDYIRVQVMRKETEDAPENHKTTDVA